MHTPDNLHFLVRELESIAEELEGAAQAFKQEHEKECEELLTVIEQIERSWSNSWLGYQANVYYRNFQKVPPGAYFSKEWGIIRSQGDWVEYEHEDVWLYVQKQTKGCKFLDAATVEQSKRLKDMFEERKHVFLSLISSTDQGKQNDPYLNDLISQAKKISCCDRRSLVQSVQHDQLKATVTRDTRVPDGPWVCPPHIAINCDAVVIMSPILASLDFSKALKKIVSHATIKQHTTSDESAKMANKPNYPSPNKVFLVHGRDHDFRNATDVFLRQHRVETVVLDAEASGGKTLIEKFEHCSDVSYAIVLLEWARGFRQGGEA